MHCPAVTKLPLSSDRDWARHAIDLLNAEDCRVADTHLLTPIFPGLKGISVYLKDESTHLTGSLKHRLARSLFQYGLANGSIREGSTLVESSSGSTAVSEAYFARLLGLPFVAVIPSSTSSQKIEAIKAYGGTCHFVERSDQVYEAAARLADETHGYYLDQFTFAERSHDWRGNHNIAGSIFQQMKREPEPIPRWLVMSAGTGGTVATLGRYVRYNGLPTQLCVPDVEYSVFYDAYCRKDRSIRCKEGSRIEGIGRPRVEPSFVPGVIDQMIKVPDAASIAAARVLSKYLPHRVGGSTGTNFFGLCWIAASMMAQNETGPIVTLICDSGDRYTATYYDDSWLAAQGFDIAPYCEMLETFLETGVFNPAVAEKAAA